MAIYQYVNSQGALSEIEAGSSTQAIQLAKNKDPKSGVSLKTGSAPQQGPAPALPSMAQTATTANSGPKTPLLDFAGSLDQVVNLARQKRNAASLDLMTPHRGTVAASDFNSILSGFNRASDTSVQDMTKRALEADKVTYDTLTDATGAIYQVQKDASGKIIGAPVKLFGAKPVSPASNYNPNELLSVSEAQALGVPFGTTHGQAAAKGIVPKDASTDALTAAQKTKTDSINAVVSQMDNYRSLIEKNGVTGANVFGKDAATIRTAKSALEFAIAAAVGTGALQAADRAVVQDLLPDPTSLKGAAGIAARGGNEGALASIDEAKKIFNMSLSAVNSPNPTQSATPASDNGFSGKTSNGLDYTVTF